jgi:glutamate-5-semialdehyde dehydrogenase
MDTIHTIVRNLAQSAKAASYKLASKSAEEKNAALVAMAKSIDEHRSIIKAENSFDIRAAKEAGLSTSLVERLMLNDQRIDSMIASINDIASLSDPVGKLITSKMLDNGLELKKVRVPIGVIAIIFESRPNVIADVSALCLKSGNAVILRGGKEAEHSNRAIMKAIDEALVKINFVPFAVQMVPVADRAAVTHLCQQNDLVDVVIPRGGEGLIKAVVDCATVPVIKHYKGVCHVYVDAAADVAMALSICHNAKCQRPGVCNAAETILVHKDCAVEFLPKLYQKFSEAGVEMRGDDKARVICPGMGQAHESDWTEEYLDLIVAIKVVNSLDDAIAHINAYGSHHSDAIVSNNKNAAQRFIKEIDSAAVYINASTRFTDGGMFGLGAEMGISTDKLHARGPMALEELCTYKWVGVGSGQVRE